MDEPTLRALIHALEVSPDNLPLFAVVLRQLDERGEHDRGLTLLQAHGPRFEAAAEQVVAASIARQGGAPALALDLLVSDAPPCRLERARALAALERLDEAKVQYRRAVEESPGLEDRELARALSQDEPENLRRLRVVANDNTDDSEVHRLLSPALEPVTFADVGGLTDIKKQIEKRIILPFQKPSLFARFKKRAGGGILMYGPPGCGKTLLARATAGECKATFFNVQISDVLDMYIGESEQKLHALFEKARQSAPAVLFFDEVEALGGKRQFTRESTSSKLVSQFLSEMDGFGQNNHGVLILGATNVPWAVDAAFRRPGRFDRVLFVPPPDLEARRSILELLLKDRPAETDLRLDDVAKRSSGFSGADLQNVVETAVDEAIQESIQRGGEHPVSRAHLQEALRQVKPTTMEWLTTARNYARYSNESGHYDEVLAFLERWGKA